MGEDAMKIFEGGQAMTKEQETIHNIKTFIKSIRSDLAEESNDNQELADDIETVLNMLKEKDKEIKTLTQTNKSYKGMIRKKDRQINYMANFINDNTPYTKDTKELENEEGIRTANFTTKFFERKSKEC